MKAASLTTASIPLACLWTVLALGAGSARADTADNASPRGGASATLSALFNDADDQALANDPLGALGRGDLRHANHFGDYVTPDHFRNLERQARANLARLGSIDRRDLDATQRIGFDVFRYQQELALRGFDSGATEIQRRLPLDQLFGFHVTFPDMSSGQTIARFQTVEDYENGLARMRGFVRYLENVQTAMRQGIAEGHVQHRFVTMKVIDQLESTIAGGVDGSPLMGPTQSFPESFTAEDRKRLERDYRKLVASKVLPAYERLAEFMRKTYLPASRTGAPGLVGLPEGDVLYRHLVEQHTGLTLSADQIHQIGLDEVARIRGEMQAVLHQVGFEGDLQQFFEHLRSDPQFKFQSAEQLLASYEQIWQSLRPRMARLFHSLPETAFEIRPVPASIEQTTTGAYYNAGSADGSRPGVFYVNTYDLPSRTSPTLETLFLHEALPGHHMQASLAQENESLPPLLRFGWDTAYIEGWGLYAESLGPELGFFEDPYQRFGHLDLEMFRALRLVVDTGLHAKGWSREKAVRYMLENSSLSETVLVADVDRYVVWPGQALAYKLGQIAIRNLRNEAEAALGEAFDVRAFHDQVLGTGVLPIPILEAKVRTWIASQNASGSTGGRTAAVDVLPLACEVDLALSAAPPHLREDATVYALGADGYREVRAGTNPFTCIVNRDHPRVLKPTCFDREGADTIVPKILFFGRSLMAGKSVETVRQEVDEAFDDGTFVSPRRPGIAYMLSRYNRPYNPRTDQLGWFPPHVMFYAPNLTTEDIGFSMEAFHANNRLPGIGYQGPHGYMIMLADDGQQRSRADLNGCPDWVHDG